MANKKYEHIAISKEFKKLLDDFVIGRETYEETLKRLCSFDRLVKMAKRRNNENHTI